MVEMRRFDIFLVSFDPCQGFEIKKTRPCVVISPDEMNRSIKTVIVAPMTRKVRSYPTRIYIQFNHQEGSIVLDQIRTVDKSHFVKKLGSLDSQTSDAILACLKEMFR